MLQRLPTALAHVRASNASENLLSEIQKVIFCAKQKKVLKRYITIQWIQRRYNTKMDTTILMNSGFWILKSSDPYRIYWDKIT